MRNAPLFYALVQIKFNMIGQMADYALHLQNALRLHGYPDYRPIKRIEISTNPEPTLQETQKPTHISWHFINNSRTEGYVLQADSLSFHTTDYHSFLDFLQKMISGLKLVHEAVTLAYIERIGLRYVNAIAPDESHNLSDYLNQSLIGLPIIPRGVFKHSFTESVCEINTDTLVTRALVAEHGILLPPDLFPLQLEIQPRFTSLKGKTAVLDVDHYTVQRQDLDMSLIDNQLSKLHDILKEAFQASTTPYAKKVWE